MRRAIQLDFMADDTADEEGSSLILFFVLYILISFDFISFPIEYHIARVHIFA